MTPPLRGSSLSKDLRALIDDPKYSDVKIECSDGVLLHGCRAILAARSDMLESLLYNQMRESHEDTIRFPDHDSKTVRVLLEYVYTGEFGDVEGSLMDLIDAFSAAEYFLLPELQTLILAKLSNMTTDDPSNSSPELLSMAIDKISPTAKNHPFIDLLVEGVAEVPLETISHDKLSTRALEYLLRYCWDNNISLVKHEYDLFKFVVLHAASKVSPEALDRFQTCLPPLEEIKNNSVYSEHIEDLSSYRLSVTKELGNMLNYVNLKVISGKVLADVIEPLEVVSPRRLLDAYRHKAMSETYNERARVSQSIETGLHEWDIFIEVPSSSDWVGICGEGSVIDFNHEDYNSKVWILGSTGHVSNKAQQRPYCPQFMRNTKVTVHLNMNDRTVGFSVNDASYGPVTEWRNLPSKVYPLISMRNGGKFRIQRRS
ncbi:9275_t:CDS:2 [Acaulospora colombiana]|uniref:9275_t:CDS:1 n=1 Tax=Acaulospora colombiana TaxID=27376 RepID=A0ACA9LTR9_9GLOM|nr:9275_t:CDS:2 [Acaulospora colombiana]